MQRLEFTPSQILMLRNYIDKHLYILARKIEICTDIERTIVELNQQLNDKANRFIINTPGKSELRESEAISTRLRQLEIERQVSLREIDNIVAVIGANIALLIDQCMIKYNVQLKHWTVRCIKRLVDFREMMMNSGERDFVFPTATAQLAGYVFKTRTAENAERFAIVRNAIRDLVNQ